MLLSASAERSSAEHSGWPRTRLAICRTLPLEDAPQLVRLYAETDSPKFEAAARRWLGRYLEEQSPSLLDFAQMAASLAQRDHR
jgi:hypothetical protein